MEKPELSRTLLNNANIRKITIGSRQDNMTYHVGQNHGVGDKDDKPLIITRIIRDENSYHLYGRILYLIYVTHRDHGDKEFLWKYTDGQPVTVEIDLMKHSNDQPARRKRNQNPFK